MLELMMIHLMSHEKLILQIDFLCIMRTCVLSSVYNLLLEQHHQISYACVEQQKMITIFCYACFHIFIRIFFRLHWSTKWVRGSVVFCCVCILFSIFYSFHCYIYSRHANNRVKSVFEYYPHYFNSSIRRDLFLFYFRDSCGNLLILNVN